MRAIVAKFGGFVRGGLDIPRQSKPDMLSMFGSPGPELEGVLRSRRFGIAQHSVYRDALVAQHGDGFVGGRSLHHDITTISKVIGERVPNQHVPIDD
jgi:hypothetical protein